MTQPRMLLVIWGKQDREDGSTFRKLTLVKLNLSLLFPSHTMCLAQP